MVASHFVILGLTSLVYVTYADEVVLPGAKVRLAQNGLDYGKWSIITYQIQLKKWNIFLEENLQKSDFHSDYSCMCFKKRI